MTEAPSPSTNMINKSDFHNQDPRFTMTVWERESTDRLRQACEEKQIQYNSLFELVKYVMIAKSSCEDNDAQADQKRLKVALTRLQKRRAFEAKYKLNDISLEEALEQVVSGMPDYFDSNYTQDREGRIIVAQTPTESTWIHQSDQNLAYFLKIELHRADLAAANMEEARRGMAMAIHGGGRVFSVRTTVAFVKMLVRARPMNKPIHNHRVKRIYVQASPSAAKHINMVKKLVPDKMAQRVMVVSTLKELHEQVGRVADGNHITLESWIAQRQEVYDMTLQKLD